jgi:hypothetical protein
MAGATACGLPTCLPACAAGAPTPLISTPPTGYTPAGKTASAPAKTPAWANSHAFALNQAWLAAALIAATLLAWLRLLALDGPLAKAEPKTLRYRILDAAGRLACSGRRQITALPQAP